MGTTPVFVRTGRARHTSPVTLTSVPSDTGDDAWGPTYRGGSGRRRRRRVIAALVVLFVILPLAYALALATRVSSTIQRVEVTNLSGGSGPLHVLVIGSDSREGLSEQDQTELTTGYVEGERTDSIFLMTIHRGRVGLLAFPRDLYVTRCDGTNGRINAALGLGGPDCLIRTVSDLSGIPIDHYIAVSFGGFRQIVDSVGGVDLCLEKPLNDPFAGVDLPAGCQTLTGPQALGYVRTRKLDNDLERIKRQQRFLAALADKIATPATVLNPPRAWELSGAVSRALTADDDLGLWDLSRVGLGLRGLASGSAVSETVPANGANIGGAAVLVPDMEAAAPIFAGFRDGSALAEAGAVDRADVSVQVLNGAGVSGLAGRTADSLRARGYQVAGVGDAETSETTRILHPAGAKAAAELLAGDLPVDPAIEERSDVSVVTLVLGTDLANGIP